MNHNYIIGAQISEESFEKIEELAERLKEMRSELGISTFSSHRNVDEVVAVLFTLPEMEDAIEDALDKAEEIITRSLLDDFKDSLEYHEKHAFETRKKLEEAKQYLDETL